MKSLTSFLCVPFIIWLLVMAAVACPGGRVGNGISDDEFGPPRESPRVCDDGWVKYAGNPVFNNGAAGEWDEGGVTCFVVRHFPWGYMMWYSCGAAYERGFGLATSDDGVNWTRHPDNPVMAPDSGVVVWGPEVLHDGEHYHMWFVARGPDFEGIGHATSDDGAVWVQSEHNPVIGYGGCNAVIWDGERYRMFLQAEGFKLLLSDDGETWDDRGVVFPSGWRGTWDEIIAAPSVAYYEDQLHLWYTGADTVGNQRGEIAIGHSTSDDWGETWVRPRDRTLLRMLRPSERWEGRGLYSSGVDFDGTTIYIWYAATGASGGFGFASRQLNSVPSNEIGRELVKLWSVAPNPMAGAVCINYLGAIDVPVSIGLYDVGGRMVFQRDFASHEPMRLDPAASGIPTGEYLLRVEYRGRILHSQMVVVQ